MKKCPNCNAEFKDNSGFCRSCGYDLNYMNPETENYFDIEADDYIAVKTEEKIILPKVDSELEKKHAQILAEGISSLILAVSFAPIGLPLAIQNTKQAKKLLVKTGELKNKALVGYTLSKIAKIYSIILLSTLGGVFTIMLISALLQ